MSDISAASQANRLASEHSPYLLQHAHNPVDWYPWGDEAFAAAEREDRPIFLSIGYATCHWCHVMEHESFEDPEVARLMNSAFINVKVDREERPDVDEVYMTVAQLLTGGGGWPLTIIMTPDRRPFFAATYLPKETRFGRMGMLELVPKVDQLWRQERDKLLSSADEITGHLQQATASGASGEVDQRAIEAAYQQLVERFDRTHGGFGSAPKFPSPHTLLFLLDHARHNRDSHGTQMVDSTLHAMRRGGIWDHVGFGFHRYSTDRQWLLPHFEKMLYDQAMMTLACSEAFVRTGDSRHAQTVREILTYVQRDMTSSSGAFYSAEDADSEGEEGRFTVWSMDELAAILGDDELELVRTVWNVRSEGNFADEASGHSTGANILHLANSLEELAPRVGLEPAELERRLEVIRQRLFAVREDRVHPLKDDKVLADWNGLMAAAFARAGRLLHEPQYTEAARRAVNFVDQSMRDDDGELMHRWREGHLAIPAFLDDHVFLTWACLELYDATLDSRWLERAVALEATTFTKFWDDTNGGFYTTARDAEALLVRPKDAYDGAIPSGNSVAVHNLVRLGHLTGRSELLERADAVVQSFAGLIRRAPSGFTHMLDALQLATADPIEVVVVGDPKSADTQALIEAARQERSANLVLLLLPTASAAREHVVQLAPFTKGLTTIEGTATAYVCRQFACELPVTTTEELVKKIRVQESS